MARLPYLTEKDLADADKDLLARDINLARVLAHSPSGARAFSKLGYWIRYQCGLDPRLREMAILQVGYVACSPYEFSHHIKIGRDFGVQNSDIEAMIAESRGGGSDLPEAERAVLCAAREMTADGRISGDTFAILRRHFSAENIVDLTIVTGFYNGVVRLLASLEVDVEESYASYLREFPLPNTADS